MRKFWEQRPRGGRNTLHHEKRSVAGGGNELGGVALAAFGTHPLPCQAFSHCLAQEGLHDVWRAFHVSGLDVGEVTLVAGLQGLVPDRWFAAGHDVVEQGQPVNGAKHRLGHSKSGGAHAGDERVDGGVVFLLAHRAVAERPRLMVLRTGGTAGAAGHHHAH